MNGPRLEFPTRVATSRAIGAEPDADRIAAIVAEQKFKSLDAARTYVREHLDAAPRPVPDDPMARARECLARTVKWHEDPSVRNVLVDEALELDPGNADALRLIADRERDPARRLAGLERAIEAARARLGDAAVAELRGPTWTRLGARPYLRARARLAETLIEAGRFAEARTACEALLELDEGDGLGMRHRLGTLYLADGDTAAFARLVARFPRDETGFRSWGRVFAALIDADDAAAEAAHAHASKACGGVAGHLLSPWLEPESSDQYALGEESEAIAVALELYPVLCRHPSLLPWITARTPHVKPRTNRTSKLLATLRPFDSVDSEPLWLEWLLRSEGRPSAALELAVRFTGARATPWIVSLLEASELDQDGAIGSGRGPASAARLLGSLVPPAALESLALVLVRTDPGSPRWFEVLAAIERYGATALEPLLSARALLAMEGAEGRDRRLVDVCEPLSHLGVRDDRIFDALCTAFDLEPGLGAVFFAIYGDVRAIPRLSAWIEGRRLDVTDESVVSNMDSIDVLDALRELAGSLTPAQQALEHRIDEYRAAFRSQRARMRGDHDEDGDEFGDDRDDADTVEADLADHDRDDGGAGGRSGSRVAPPTSGIAGATSGSMEGPASDDRFLAAGRNDPCPCGSGRKFKKCCWDSKRAG